MWWSTCCPPPVIVFILRLWWSTCCPPPVIVWTVSSVPRSPLSLRRSANYKTFLHQTVIHKGKTPKNQTFSLFFHSQPLPPLFNVALLLVIAFTICFYTCVFVFTFDQTNQFSYNFSTFYVIMIFGLFIHRIEKDCVFSWNISSKLLGFLCLISEFFSWMVVLFSIFWNPHLKLLTVIFSP